MIVEKVISNNVNVLQKIFFFEFVVLEDLQMLMKMHFTTLKNLAQEGELSIVKQNQKQKSHPSSRPMRTGYSSQKYGQAPSSLNQAPDNYYAASKQSYTYSGY